VAAPCHPARGARADHPSPTLAGSSRSGLGHAARRLTTAALGSGIPFDVVTGGLDQVLFRPTAEVSDDAKVKIIGRIREQGTIEGNKFLKDVQKRWAAGSSPRVRQAIDQAVMATAGGAQ
jgi:hypothetical protein